MNELNNNGDLSKNTNMSNIIEFHDNNFSNILVSNNYHLLNKNKSLDLWPNLIFICIYVVLFFVGLISNFIVIYFVLVYKRMQTMTNKFITNLSLADLLVTFICIPVTASRYMSNDWLLGEIMCRISSFIQGKYLLFKCK
jgi:hypothetical protein